MKLVTGIVFWGVSAYLIVDYLILIFYMVVGGTLEMLHMKESRLYQWMTTDGEEMYMKIFGRVIGPNMNKASLYVLGVYLVSAIVFWVL